MHSLQTSIAWPSATPVCFMVEGTPTDVGTPAPRWLHPRAHLRLTNLSSIYEPEVWGPCQASLNTITQLGYFWIHEVDPGSNKISLITRFPANDSIFDDRRPSRIEDIVPNPESVKYVGVQPLPKFENPFGFPIPNLSGSMPSGFLGAMKDANAVMPGGSDDAAATETSPPDEAVFTYVLLDPADDGRQRIALRTSSGKFLTYDARSNTLFAGAQVATQAGVALTVDEPVLRKEIVITSVSDTYKTQPTEPAIDYTSVVSNPGSATLTKDFTFSHEKSLTGTWNNATGRSLTVSRETSVSLSAGVEASCLSAKTEVTQKWGREMTTDVRQSWGGSSTETQTIEDGVSVNVPAHTNATLRVRAERAVQSVDFTYDVNRIGLLGEEWPPSTGNAGVWSKVETLNTTVDVTTSEARAAHRKGPKSKVNGAARV